MLNVLSPFNCGCPYALLICRERRDQSEFNLCLSACSPMQHALGTIYAALLEATERAVEAVGHRIGCKEGCSINAQLLSWIQVRQGMNSRASSATRHAPQKAEKYWA